MQTTHKHNEPKRNVKCFVDSEINPSVDEWQAAEIFPAHELLKKMGDQGLLGISRPVEYGGLGLDYSYSVAMAEALGDIQCGDEAVACVGVSETGAGSNVAAIQTSARRIPNPHLVCP